MKKGLIFLLGIVSFLGINTVSADTINTLYHWYDDYEKYIEDYNNYKNNIDSMINYWEDNLSNQYPYFILVEDLDGGYTYSTGPTFSLYFSSNNYIELVSGSFDKHSSEWGGVYTYDSTNNEYDLTMGNISSQIFYINSSHVSADEYRPLLVHDMKYIGSTTNGLNFLIPSYNSEFLSINIPEIELKDNSLFPGLIDLYDGSYMSGSTINYEEINLNDYSYIALSLKDYDTIPENSYSTYTNLYVKGQLCITPVYNFGMTERKDILTGTQVQRCSSYYNDFTSTRMYILPSDVKNHAIYYLKAYDNSKDNIIKVDSTVFDVSYITEENKDNPYVNILGKEYPTLSYDSLTDTATKSEDNDYNSGVSCAVGDFNCYEENNTSNMFNDLFDKPLDMLKTVWSAIISIFDLIGQFILLLPPTMQGFLYMAFGIGIVLGIIKILL